MRSIFISYSSKDRSVVLPLGRLLDASGSRPFIDINDIHYSEEWELRIDEAIKESRSILVFWSRNAAKSLQVEKEWRLALSLKKPVIPVLIDEKSKLPDDLKKFHGVHLFEILARRDRSWFQGHLSQEQQLMRQLLTEIAHILILVDPDFESGLQGKLQAGYRDGDYLHVNGSSLKQAIVKYLQD